MGDEWAFFAIILSQFRQPSLSVRSRTERTFRPLYSKNRLGFQLGVDTNRECSMATSTNLDAHEHVAIKKRIGEIQSELTRLGDSGESRLTMARHWERLLDELADLKE